MNSYVTASAADLISEPLVSNGYFWIHLQIIFFCLRPAMNVFGIFANLLNLIVFYKMGLGDSVVLSFFALSLADFLYVLVCSIGTVCTVFLYSVPEITSFWPVDAIGLNGVTYWYANIFYDASMMITVYIALVRCCIVAIPLRFRGVFTQTRTILVLAAILLIAAVSRALLFKTMYLAAVLNKLNNQTKLVYRETDDRPLAVALNDIINRNILPWSSAGIMFFCLAIFARKLTSASRFRQASQTGSSKSTRRSKKKSFQEQEKKEEEFQNQSQQTDRNPLGDDRSCAARPSKKDSEESSARMRQVRVVRHTGLEKSGQLKDTSKDLQLIKSVALITALYLVLVLPFMMYSMVRRFIPDFTSNPRYANLFNLVSTTSILFSFLGASVNTFVYYHVNSRYRRTVQTLISEKSLERKL